MENILKKQYAKYLKFTFILVRSWPLQSAGKKRPIYKTILICWLIFEGLMVVFGQVYYVIANKNLNFDITGQIWLGVFFTSVYVGRLIVCHTRKYEKLMLYFFKEFHLEHFPNKDQYYYKIYNKIEKLSNYYSVFMAVNLASAVLFLNGAPILKNILNGWYFNPTPPNSTFDYAIFFYPPSIHAEYYPIISTAYNIYLVSVGFFTTSGMDTLVVLMVFQVLGRISITSEMIRNVKLPVMDLDLDHGPGQIDGDIQAKTVHKQLIAIIKEHKEIVSFADMISDLFGPLIAHVYLFDLVGGCVLLLELTSSDLSFVLRFGPISLSLFAQLIQISITFELIGYMSEKLIDDVYCMPWTDMSISDQRVVRILLMRVQQPIQVTAIGMIPVGVKTMASLLRASLSYYLFLNSKKQ